MVSSVISVRKLTQVFVFPGGFVVSGFGPDHAFQLLTLTAGLVSLLAFVPAKFQRSLPGLGTSVGCGLSALALTSHSAHPSFQGNVLFCVFW